jgi:ATP-binding cassette subfamily C protein
MVARAAIYDVVVRLPLRMRGGGDGTQPLRDLDHIRSFLASGGPSALADLPWAPFYLAICFMFHPLIGISAIIGGVILTIITLCAEIFSRGPIKAASTHQATAIPSEASRRNAGSSAPWAWQKLGSRWSKANSEHLKSQRLASDVSGGLGSLSKALRMLLQSAVLGLGAWLVIQQEASPGVIIASSILVSRALAPVELAIANWKGFISARQGWRRLTNMMAMLPVEEAPLELPAPQGALVVEGIAAVPPSERRVVLNDISFDLKAGAGLGVIGPSASGKSSLARVLVGVWPAARGKVRLDGAALEQWSRSFSAIISVICRKTLSCSGNRGREHRTLRPSAGCREGHRRCQVRRRSI